MKLNGKATTFLRVVQPWLILFVSAIALPTSIGAIGFLLNHRDDHSDIERFMRVGGRVYSSSGESVSTDQLAREFRDLIDAEIATTLGDLTIELRAMRAEVAKVRVEVGKLQALIERR